MSDKKKKIIELIDSALREADLSWYQRKSTIVRCIDDIMDIVTPAPETKKCEESRADEINKLCDSAFGVGKCEEKCEIIFRCKVCASLLDECVIKECPCKCHQKEEKPVEYRVCEKCGKPFPCSFQFEGTPVCFDCFVLLEAPKPECSTWCNPKCLADPCPCSCHGNPQSACLCNGVECICHTPKEELKRRTETHTVEPEERRHEFDGISALCKHCGLNYLYWRKCPCKPKEPKPEKCENLTSEEFGERYGLKKSDYYTKQEIDSQTQLLFEMMKSIPKAARYIDAFIEEKKEFKRAFPFL